MAPPPPRDVRDAREAERAGLQWVRVDMHLHTPASADYRDPDATYLKVLQRAEERGLDIIAFTDHNSVQGYAQMIKEIEMLELLERLNRLNEQETHDLAEYRRLRETLLVLPGFEFTATFGFHILGIFPPGTSLRQLELVLLRLDVPEQKMLAGAPDAGPTSDVIEAYVAIAEAGGLPIAAHANSSNGVVMQGFTFGGQTRIAYTQHPKLVALEVTDLEQSGRRTTESFFNGSKPEYPRRMHCIQGSDAHSIEKEPGEGLNKRLGIGDRCTEMLLPDITFEALRTLLVSNEFDRTRPYRPGQEVAHDFVRQARSQGPSIIQAFHERPSTKTNRTRGVLKDIAAFANTNGGTVYCGVSADENVPVRGVDSVEETISMLRLDVQRSIVPPLDVTFIPHVSEGRNVVLVQVPRGGDRPYMFEPAGQIYLRQEADSVAATRDDIVRLVLEAHGERLNAELAAAALSVPTAASADTAHALQLAEEMSGDMIEEAIAGSSVPLDLAHRRKRRRRRGGERPATAGDALGDAGADDEPDTVPAWTTTPAWDAPEDHPATAARDIKDAEAAARRDFAARYPAIPEPSWRESWTPAADEDAPESLAAELVAVLEPEPAIPAETQTPPPAGTETAADVPRTRRKGWLYQVHRADLGEPDVGNAQRERRTGLYADRAGELLAADLRASNPEGLFELERNQLWLPAEVTPVLPGDLVARRRSRTLMNDSVLNAKSGPGGRFQTMGELAPPPPPVPEPEPAPPEPLPVAVAPAAAALSGPDATTAPALAGPQPAPETPRKPAGRGRRKAAPAEEPVAQAAAPEPAGRPRRKAAAAPEPLPAIPVVTAPPPPEPPGAPPAPEPAAAPVPVTPIGRVLPGEKLSGARVRGGVAVPPTDTRPGKPAAAAPPQPRAGRAAAASPESRPAKSAVAPPPESRAGSPAAGAPAAAGPAAAAHAIVAPAVKPAAPVISPPRTGVEIVESEVRNGVPYHAMRDLRNGSIVHNVTRYSARRLWYYAIMRHEAGPPELQEVAWTGTVGLWRTVRRANVLRYDLVGREPDDSLRIYYGVTEDGIHGPWRTIDLTADEPEQSDGEQDWG